MKTINIEHHNALLAQSYISDTANTTIKKYSAFIGELTGRPWNNRNLLFAINAVERGIKVVAKESEKGTVYDVSVTGFIEVLVHLGKLQSTHASLLGVNNGFTHLNPTTAIELLFNGAEVPHTDVDELLKAAVHEKTDYKGIAEKLTAYLLELFSVEVGQSDDPRQDDYPLYADIDYYTLHKVRDCIFCGVAAIGALIDTLRSVHNVMPKVGAYKSYKPLLVLYFEIERARYLDNWVPTALLARFAIACVECKKVLSVFSEWEPFAKAFDALSGSDRENDSMYADPLIILHLLLTEGGESIDSPADQYAGDTIVKHLGDTTGDERQARAVEFIELALPNRGQIEPLQ